MAYIGPVTMLQQQPIQIFPSSGEGQILLSKIRKAHLAYLQMDDTPKKLNKREMLEGLILQYLIMVPSKERFPCPAFSELLQQNIECKEEFNGYKAARAFDALDRYAMNLIIQPWRKEFRCIRLYAGYYQHLVASHLQGAERAFHLMGYVPVTDVVLLLEDPVDPDRVIDVSLNCLIATVECQLMTKVYEKLGGACTWKEIGNVRRHHTCGIERIIDLLISGRSERHRNRHALPRISAAANGVNAIDRLIDWQDSPPPPPPVKTRNYMSELLLDGNTSLMRSDLNGFGRPPHPSSVDVLQPLTLEEHLEASHTLLQRRRAHHPESGLSSGSGLGNVCTSTREDCWGFVDKTLENQGFMGDRNDIMYSSQATTSQSGEASGQPLIPPISNSAEKVVADLMRQIDKSVMQPTAPPLPPTRSSSHKRTPSAPEPATLDYPDLLQLDPLCPTSTWCQYPAPYRVMWPSLPAPYGVYQHYVVPPYVPYAPLPPIAPRKSDEIDSKSKGYYQEQKAPKKHELSVEGVTLRSTPKTEKDRTSWYDNVHSDENVSVLSERTNSLKITNSEKNGQKQSYRPPMETIHRKPDRTPSDSESSKLRNPVRTKSPPVVRHQTPSPDRKANPVETETKMKPWACRSCTYFNKRSEDICEVCSRSRNRGAESEPLATGGHECQKCTLVNEKTARQCAACGFTLENSPTYV